MTRTEWRPFGTQFCPSPQQTLYSCDILLDGEPFCFLGCADSKKAEWDTKIAAIIDAVNRTDRYLSYGNCPPLLPDQSTLLDTLDEIRRLIHNKEWLAIHGAFHRAIITSHEIAKRNEPTFNQLEDDYINRERRAMDHNYASGYADAMAGVTHRHCWKNMDGLKCNLPAGHGGQHQFVPGTMEL